MNGEKESAGKIGLIPCLAFAVGTMVGGGVFTLSGTAINEAGPGALLSYLLAGIVMLLSALSFVAVSARAKEGDSGYGPVGEILSPVWRFVVMWGFYLNGLTLLAFLLVSFGDYMNDYFVPAIGVTTFALIAITAISALNLGPVDAVGRIETLVVGIKIGLLFLLVAWGLTEIKGDDFTPFAPDGASGIFSMSALLFTAYTGFNVVTNMAGSVRNPERTVPIAIIGSVLISATLYMGVIVAMLASGIDHFGPAGVADAATALMGDWGGYMIAAAACLSTLSGANANLLGASELMLRLVAQGDVPPGAGRTTKRGHPFISVIVLAGIAVVMVLLANIHNIVAYSNVAALVAMLVVNAAAFRLARQGWPGKGFRLPGGVAIPVVASVACLFQFPSLGWGHVTIGLAMIGIGLLLYRGRHLAAASEEQVPGRVRQRLTRLQTPLARAMRGVGRG